MKTVEFKLFLNQSQQAKVNDWLNVQRWVWNQGLHLLEEPRQLAEKYSKKLLLPLPRSVYLSSFYGRYRAWAWEQTPGESVRTLNQEAMQVAPPCDAGTTFEAQPIGRIYVNS